MYNQTEAKVVGQLVDPEIIKRERLNPASLYRVVATLAPAEVDVFERDLRAYERGAQQSPFLLGILAVAAGKACERNPCVTAFDIQSNVVGLHFSEPERAANAC